MDNFSGGGHLGLGWERVGFVCEMDLLMDGVLEGGDAVDGCMEGVKICNYAIVIDRKSNVSPHSSFPCSEDLALESLS